VNLCSNWHYTPEALWGAAVHLLGTTDLSQGKRIMARKVLTFTLFFAGYMPLIFKSFILYHTLIIYLLLVCLVSDCMALWW
jgi:hypothetical protein